MFVLGYRMVAVAVLAMSGRTVEVGSERLMMIHSCLRVGVRLVVQIHRSYGTQEVAYVNR